MQKLKLRIFDLMKLVGGLGALVMCYWWMIIVCDLSVLGEEKVKLLLVFILNNERATSVDAFT